MRSEIKGFETIVREISSEIREDPTYANPTYARFTVRRIWFGKPLPIVNRSREMMNSLVAGC